MDGRCVAVGKPHPSLPFTEHHLTMYKIARATRRKLHTDENLADEKKHVCNMEGSIVHPIVRKHLCGILKNPSAECHWQLREPNGNF